VAAATPRDGGAKRPAGRRVGAGSDTSKSRRAAADPLAPSVARTAALAEVIVTRTGAEDRAARRASDAGRQARLHIEFFAEFAGFGAVVVGWLADPLDQVSAILVDTGSGQPVDLAAEGALLRTAERYEVFDIPRDLSAKYGFVLRLAEAESVGHQGLTVELWHARGRRCYGLLPTGAAACLGQIIARAPLAYARAVIGRLIGDGDAQGSATLPQDIAAILSVVQEGINPALNHGSERSGTGVECRIEGVIRIGTEGVVVTGWILHDDSDRIEEVALVSLFGRRVVLDSPLPAVARADVIEARAGEVASRNHDCGFIAFAPVPQLAREDRCWFLELVIEGGIIRRFPFICPPTPEPLRGIRASIGLVHEEIRDLPDLFERVISPSADWFWAATRRNNPQATEIVYGVPPTGARISVVVPLFGRIDLMRYQIAAFSNDPSLASAAATAELIYVLDDPSAEGEFRRLCQHLDEVYRVPFRTELMSRNLGYAAANNAGAAAATGALLLFLNSDVLPARPGWVDRLADTYRALDRCGILGCRLLFEDGSIQHAGMTFRASTLVPGCWENDHPGKGLPVAFDPHRGPVAVPAVTAACLVVDRALFAELGGMSEDYVIGDFEDSDLCLRAQERGWNVYYTPEVELFHLERQSMRLIGGGEACWRQSLTLYNMWKHSRRWGALIPAVLDRLGC
jgi:GT2 family glycosyltransferase